ncbi:MAG: 3-phenylpropionate/cinnamic acid dioxygenase subunit beta [Gammaproteobacteria bacterium]
MLKHFPSLALADHAAIDPALQQEIEQFLYREAQLLDEREFDQWLALMSDDVHYYMPTRYNPMKRAAGEEFSAPDQAALFDEDKQNLTIRVKRLHTGLAWAEEPPSRTRHMVSNVQIHPTADGAEFEVDCNFMLYRNRLERDVDLFVGARRDLLRKRADDGGWQIARRYIALDQTTVLASNMSIFF